MFKVSYADVFDAIEQLEDESVHLLLTDPPYFKVVGEPWDHAWDSPGGFLEWMGKWLSAVKPKMSKRGTVVVFTSPAMFGRVEAKIAESFSVFGNVVWQKDSPGRLGGAENGSLRGPWGLSERIVFAEQGTEDPWVASRQRLAHAAAREAYVPLIERLIAIQRAADLTNGEVDQILGTSGMAGHYFGYSQWALPTEEAWAKLRPVFEARIDERGSWGDIPDPARLDYEHLRLDYEHLRLDYEHLRLDYEHLRRRWNSNDYDDWRYLCDVWEYPTVGSGPGRHVCEKPYPLLRHIVDLTTDSDDLVFDPFVGSGATGETSILAGRRFVGSDLSPYWATKAAQRCGFVSGELESPPLPELSLGEPLQLMLGEGAS